MFLFISANFEVLIVLREKDNPGVFCWPDLVGSGPIGLVISAQTRAIIIKPRRPKAVALSTSRGQPFLKKLRKGEEVNQTSRGKSNVNQTSRRKSNHVLIW